MNFEAIKTIRIHNWSWSRIKAIKFADSFINLISNKYPLGIEDIKNQTYFVVPGFEHVTKNQPIIKFNPAEGAWELSVTNLLSDLNNIHIIE
jgi:hypothetical protein